MKQLLMTTAAIILVGGMTGAHAAVTATFCGPASEGGVCEGTGELKVFLDKAADVTTGFADVGTQKAGAPQMTLTSDGGSLNIFIDLSSGFGTITPFHPAVSFNGLDIKIPGFTFTDLVFDVQTTGQTGDTLKSFVVDAYSGAHVLDGIGNELDNSNTDKTFSVFAHGGAFDEVNLLAPGGFEEIKHIEVSGLAAAVPEASTWAMMLGGFGLLGLMALRRGGGARAIA